MPFLGTLLGWLGGGIIKLLGNDVLAPILKTIQNGQDANRDVAVSTIQAEIAANNAKAAVAPAFKPLVYMIALPFVAHSAMVMIDSCIPLGFPHMGIPAAPSPFCDYEAQILLGLCVSTPLLTLAHAGASRLLRR